MQLPEFNQPSDFEIERAYWTLIGFLEDKQYLIFMGDEIAMKDFKTIVDSWSDEMIVDLYYKKLVDKEYFSIIRNYVKRRLLQRYNLA